MLQTVAGHTLREEPDHAHLPPVGELPLVELPRVQLVRHHVRAQVPPVHKRLLRRQPPLPQRPFLAGQKRHEQLHPLLDEEAEPRPLPPPTLEELLGQPPHVEPVVQQVEPLKEPPPHLLLQFRQRVLSLQQ